MKFRKITAIGLALCMSAAITACGSNNTHKETVNTESVATTTTSRTETNETKKPSVSMKPTETATPTPTKTPEPESKASETKTTASEKDKATNTKTAETKSSDKTDASSTAKTTESKSANASNKASADTKTKPASKPSSGSTSGTTTSKPQTPVTTPDPTPETKPEPTTPPHTHNYTASVTTQPTCSTAGTHTYSCSCGDSYSEPIPATGNHTWMHHDATGYYEEKIITPERTETIYEYHYICNGCNGDFGTNATAIGDHLAFSDCFNKGGYHSEQVAVGTETIPAVTESIWVEDSAAYDSCSVCGATK